MSTKKPGKKATKLLWQESRATSDVYETVENKKELAPPSPNPSQQQHQVIDISIIIITISTTYCPFVVSNIYMENNN